MQANPIPLVLLRAPRRTEEPRPRRGPRRWWRAAKSRGRGRWRRLRGRARRLRRDMKDCKNLLRKIKGVWDCCRRCSVCCRDSETEADDARRRRRKKEGEKRQRKTSGEEENKGRRVRVVQGMKKVMGMPGKGLRRMGRWVMGRLRRKRVESGE